jgi:heat shock protein HslJ
MKQAPPSPGAQTAGIEGIQWYLTEVGGSPVSPMAGDKQPHMLLDPEEKKATGFAGCNNFFGRYELDGPSLKFGPLGSTRMACPDLETGLETSLFEALESTRKWKKADGELMLLNGDAVLARFSQEKYVGHGHRGWKPLPQKKDYGFLWEWHRDDKPRRRHSVGSVSRQDAPPTECRETHPTGKSLDARMCLANRPQRRSKYENCRNIYFVKGE